MMMKRWMGLSAEQLGGGIFGMTRQSTQLRHEAPAQKGLTVGATIFTF